MSRQFSIPTVLRMVPNYLLKQFFKSIPFDHFEVDFDRFGERDVEPMVAAIVDLPRADQDLIESVLRSVFEMSCESGMQSLLEAAEKCGQFDFAAQLPDDAGYYEKAMWTWLNRKGVFEKAQQFHQVAQLSWWRKRNDLPRKTPDLSPATTMQLGEELASFLTQAQGRGQICTVEAMGLGNGLYYFFAHPDDFVQNALAHNEDGRLTPRTFRRTFMVVFAYNEPEGSLELFAKVPPKLKPRLEEIFAKTVLGEELGPWQPQPAYELKVLTDRQFVLATDPEDQLKAPIRKMRLSLDGGRRILLEIADDHNDLYRMIDECLREEHATLLDVNITSVTFRMELLPLEGRKAGTMTFDVAFPNHCGLRNHQPDRVKLAQKYLKRWGIDVARSTADDFDAIGV
jgi:hypothetical protein